MRRFEAGVVVFGRHGVLPFVGSTAPIAAFMATKGGGRTGPAPRSEAERPKRSGGWRGPAILLRDAKAAPWAAGGK